MTPRTIRYIDKPLSAPTPDRALITALYASFPYSNWTVDARGNAEALIQSLDRQGWELLRKQRVSWWRRLLRFLGRH